MRLYSRWNPTSLKWDYYQALGNLRAGVFADTPRLPRGHRFGLTPDEATRRLPSSATPAGAGDFPRGMIASHKSSLGAMPLDVGTVTRVAMWGGAAWAVWNFLLTPAQKSKAKKAIGA